MGMHLGPLHQYLWYFLMPIHMNNIIDNFAAKVGEPWILQTNLTEIQCERIGFM